MIILLMIYCVHCFVQFPRFNLTLERVWPGLFIDKHGNYWDVPVTLAADLASVTSDSGTGYHLSLQHISGSATPAEGNKTNEVPANLLPGLHLKSAISFKKNVEFWRSQGKKLKLVLPFDLFLSSSHVSGTCLIGESWFVTSCSLQICALCYQM